MILEPLSPTEIEAEFKINNMLVLPNHENFENVVAKIFWSAKLKAQNVEIDTAGESTLHIFNLTNIKPIDELTHEDLVNFVIESNGGENWLSKFKYMHGQLLADKLFESNMVSFPVPQN